MYNHTEVIGLSGKKQSGKNTAANYMIGLMMQKLGLTKNFKITPKGELYLFDVVEDVSKAGIFDITSNSRQIVDFRTKYLDKHIKLYSFADALKQDVCINILGLRWEQCYGTDADKNSETHLMWENMPGVITEQPDAEDIKILVEGRLGPYYEKLYSGIIYHKPGPMTAREVMQFVGTEIFRKMYGNVWVNATLNKIKRDSPGFAIIPDVRFPNEADSVVGLSFMSDYPTNGSILRLLRDPNNGNDTHPSETSLDEYDSSRYLAIIDNKDMTIVQQNEAIHQVFIKLIHNLNNR